MGRREDGAVDPSKFKKNPFDARCVQLALSPFEMVSRDAHQRPANRAEVEAASASVHARVQLIKSMKDNLAKLTNEAIKQFKGVGVKEKKVSEQKLEEVQLVKDQEDEFFLHDLYKIYSEKFRDYFKPGSNGCLEVNNCFQSKGLLQIAESVASELEKWERDNPYLKKEGLYFDLDKEISTDPYNILERQPREKITRRTDQEDTLVDLSCLKKWILPVSQELTLDEDNFNDEDENEIVDETENCEDPEGGNDEDKSEGYHAADADTSGGLEITTMSEPHDDNVSEITSSHDVSNVPGADYMEQDPSSFEGCSVDSIHPKLQSAAPSKDSEVTTSNGVRPGMPLANNQATNDNGSLIQYNEADDIEMEEANSSLTQCSSYGEPQSASVFGRGQCGRIGRLKTQLCERIAQDEQPDKNLISLKSDEIEYIYHAQLRQSTRKGGRFVEDVEHLLIQPPKVSMRATNKEDFVMPAVVNADTFKMSLIKPSMNLFEHFRLLQENPMQIPIALKFDHVHGDDEDVDLDTGDHTMHESNDHSLSTSEHRPQVVGEIEPQMSPVSSLGDVWDDAPWHMDPMPTARTRNLSMEQQAACSNFTLTRTEEEWSDCDSPENGLNSAVSFTQENGQKITKIAKHAQVPDDSQSNYGTVCSMEYVSQSIDGSMLDNNVQEPGEEPATIPPVLSQSRSELSAPIPHDSRRKSNLDDLINAVTAEFKFQGISATQSDISSLSSAMASKLGPLCSKGNSKIPFTTLLQECSQGGNVTNRHFMALLNFVHQYNTGNSKKSQVHVEDGFTRSIQDISVHLVDQGQIGQN